MPWVNAWVGAPNGRHPGNCRKMKKSPAGKAMMAKAVERASIFTTFRRMPTANAEGYQEVASETSR